MVEDLRRFMPDGMTLNGWAVLAGVNRTIWNDIRRHGNPSRRTMEKLLGAVGSSLAEFEALRVGAVTDTVAGASGVLAERGADGWRGAAPTGLARHEAARGPILSFASLDVSTVRLGGPIPGAFVPRPATAATDATAYAIAMPDRAMWPRFREGQILVVSPSAEARPGDDVLVRLLAPPGCALIGELGVRDARTVTIHQFEPDGDVTIEAAAVLTVERVLGPSI